LVRILGKDTDVAALLNDVFLRALRRIDRVGDASALGMWLTRIAVFTAKEHLRARRRRRWLVLFAPAEMPDAETVEAPVEIREAVACLYRALDALPADERLAFSLRHIEQMTLTEVAEACDVSLATAKRRLERAEARFGAIGRRDPLLSEWMEGGARWKLR
jgi:RNA polymerase sigma-70 factor (ECF subfamily)